MASIKERFDVSGALDPVPCKVKDQAISYQEYDRGVAISQYLLDLVLNCILLTILVESHEEVRPCSIDFLIVIISDLKTILQGYYWNHKNFSREAVKSSLQKLIKECTRLTLSPELIPDKALAKWFFCKFDGLATEIRRTIATWKRYGKRQRTHVLIMMKRYQHRARRHFHRAYKPWQQFLSRDAPGSGTGLRGPKPCLTVQVVPWAGVKLLCAWSKECKDIIKAIEEVRSVRFQEAWSGSLIIDTRSAMGLR